MELRDVRKDGGRRWPELSGESAAARLPWIEVRPGLPYLVTEDGAAWTPIGQNDSISWPELNGLFRRRDLPAVHDHLVRVRSLGVTCLRLMLEYAQGEHRYLERPVGTFAPNMVRLWDDLFALCEEVGLYLLLTPFDTFFMWTRWHRHPYNRSNGGPCASRDALLTCPQTREAVKARLAFATTRWGASPALFAWDLWNELHPAQAGNDPAMIAPFIEDVGTFLRDLEILLHGRAHLQTVSVFGPELLTTPALCEPIFRHRVLDVANTHLYEQGTIDDPRDTVAPALATGKLMRAAVAEASDLRPVFDSEHGPIHAFKDRHITLPDEFDSEYFRHMQWAHLASGGAGGGMRWPNRHPHVLTGGMRAAQAALARFLPLIDWTRFRRRNLNAEVGVPPGIAAFACGDAAQAIVWLLRTDAIGADGMLDRHAPARTVGIAVPGLGPGPYRVTFFDTREGRVLKTVTARCGGPILEIEVEEFVTDRAIAIGARP